MRIDYLPNDPQIIRCLAGWLYEQWGHLVPGRTVDTAMNTLAKRVHSMQPPLTLVAYDDGQLVGTASLTLQDMDDKPELTPWLASVYVPQKYRKRGIGSALCLRIIEEANRLGFAQAYLFTPDKESFYQRLGWVTIEHTCYRSQDVVIMRYDCIDQRADQAHPNY